MQRSDLPDLAAFETVARLRSFRQAAVALALSPSALSHAISGLEQRLGVRLLHRTTRSVAVTEAGERLLARLRPALFDIADAVEAIDSFRTNPAGTVRLSIPSSAGRLVLAPLIAEYCRRYPQMTLEIITDDTLVDIVAAGFDAGIRIDERVERDMVAVRVSPPQRFAVVGAPGYFASHPAPLTPHDLSRHRCIRQRFASGTLYRWEFERDGIGLEIAVDGPMILSDHDLMVRAAADGVGLAFVFEGHVQDHLADGRLLRVLDDWCPAFPGFTLYYPSQRHLAAGLRALIDLLRARAGGQDGARPPGQ